MELCVPSHRASNKCNVHVKLLDLRLQPGATQANSVQSADAILAYQQALDLKPNYVRAWANMGINYANEYCVQFKTMKIAVEGCMHGDFDKVYDTIKYIENTRNIKIDLLLCYGSQE